MLFETNFSAPSPTSSGSSLAFAHSISVLLNLDSTASRSFSVRDFVLERRVNWLVLRFSRAQTVPHHLIFPLPSPLEPSSGTVPQKPN